MDAITRNVIKATQVQIKNECKTISARLHNNAVKTQELDRYVKKTDKRTTILLYSMIVLQISMELLRRFI